MPEEGWLRADPKVKTMWVLSAAVGAAILPLLFLLLGGALLVASRAAGFALLIAALVMATALGLLVVAPTALWATLFYRNLSYRVGAHDVTIRRGILFRTETHIPLSRIQDVVVKQGPVMRIFGLGELHLQTAAATVDRYGQRTGEGAIPGVRDPQAAAAYLLRAIRARAVTPPAA